LVEPSPDKPRLKRRNLKSRPSDSSSASGDEEPLPDSPRAEHPPVETAAPRETSSSPSDPSSTPSSSYSLPTTPLYYTTGVPKTKEDATPMKTSPISSAASSSAARPATASATPISSSTARPASAAPAASSYQSRPATASSPGSTSAGSPSRPAAAGASSAASSYSSPRPAAAASTPSSGASSFSSARPAGTASTSSGPTRPAAASVTPPNRTSSVNDFRTNAERQAREQKSISGIIAIIVYSLVGLFALGTILAGYGAYVITRQIHKQSMTLNDLDSRYTSENHALSVQLQATNDSLARSLAQIARQQELLTREQDSLNKLADAAQANTAAWRQERQSRAGETASLRARIRDLEDQPRFGPVTH
jgi:hypothetical protein